MRAMTICLLIFATKCAARSDVPVAASAPVDIDHDVVVEDGWLKMRPQAYRQLKTNLISERAQKDIAIKELIGELGTAMLRNDAMSQELRSLSFLSKFGIWIGIGVGAISTALFAWLLVR